MNDGSDLLLAPVGRRPERGAAHQTDDAPVPSTWPRPATQTGPF
jgi:hypothetical protein